MRGGVDAARHEDPGPAQRTAAGRDLVPRGSVHGAGGGREERGGGSGVDEVRGRYRGVSLFGGWGMMGGERSCPNGGGGGAMGWGFEYATQKKSRLGELSAARAIWHHF